MEEKVNRWPIIGLIIAIAIGLATFSVLQSEQRKAQQQQAFDNAAREQASTEATMKKIGADAAAAAAHLEAEKQAAYDKTPAAIELKRLEAEDRAATALPRSSTPR
jgi:hypothetical protein